MPLFQGDERTFLALKRKLSHFVVVEDSGERTD